MVTVTLHMTTPSRLPEASSVEFLVFTHLSSMEGIACPQYFLQNGFSRGLYLVPGLISSHFPWNSMSLHCRECVISSEKYVFYW